jgi:hypothetical protein
MAHPSFMSGRRMVLRPIRALTLGRHTGSDDSPIPAAALSLHNFAAVPDRVARANSASEASTRFPRDHAVETWLTRP